MLDVFAIYSGSTVLASGTTPVLWPDIGFPATGPSAEFLAANSAQMVLSNPPYDPRFEKLVPANAYRLNGQTYNMVPIALTADELEAIRRAKENATVPINVRAGLYRQAADLRAKGDDTSRLDAYDLLTKKGLPPWP